jgi:hypothetical protein
MKTTDKVLVAFLVAAGFYSPVQAAQYVGSLTEQDKVILASVSQSAPDVVLTDGMSTQVGSPNKK